MFFPRLGIALVFVCAAVGGINWVSVWLEPRTGIVVLTTGETKSYTAMGRNGAEVNADLTNSPYLKMTSSDPEVAEVDCKKHVFTGKKPGHAHIALSFSEATEMIPVFVRVPRGATDDGVDGTWKAVFTGDWGERPKMVSEIFFDVNAQGKALTGTVHAAYWPGDAAITDGTINGDRVSFQIVGHSPFHVGSAGATFTGYPKPCFSGIRHGDAMKIELLWTEAGRSCESGSLLSMAARRLGD